jgi:hypothetical protein
MGLDVAWDSTNKNFFGSIITLLGWPFRADGINVGIYYKMRNNITRRIFRETKTAGQGVFDASDQETDTRRT